MYLLQTEAFKSIVIRSNTSIDPVTVASSTGLCTGAALSACWATSEPARITLTMSPRWNCPMYDICWRSSSVVAALERTLYMW
uniref:SFRICE_012488 n=1 Tax=Spodoptera frugiperda TaxID=7108 RepID=A0A2H1VSP6_SPOFR